MNVQPIGPSPTEFYTAFLQVITPEESKLLELWYSSVIPGTRTTQYTRLIFSLFPRIADALGLQCYPGDYLGIDAVFYRDKDIENFPANATYITSISVALEHENECPTAAEEINKLQLFNAPLKVLITYQPGNLEIQLNKYAKMIHAADVFGDFSTFRRQLVIFGFSGDGKIRWRAFLYEGGAFRELHTLAASVSGL